MPSKQHNRPDLDRGGYLNSLNPENNISFQIDDNFEIFDELK